MLLVVTQILVKHKENKIFSNKLSFTSNYKLTKMENILF